MGGNPHRLTRVLGVRSGRRIACAVAVGLTLAGCSNGDFTPADAEKHANAALRERLFTVDGGGFRREEAAADRYARVVASDVSKHVPTALGYAECNKGRCSVTVEGLLKGLSNSSAYECRAAVVVDFRGPEARVRRQEPFRCGATKSLLD